MHNLNYNQSMLYALLLFSSLLYAEDMSSEKYCFPSIAVAQVALKKYQAIQVPSDSVTSDENCLVIQMRPHRRELIQRYILAAVPSASIAFSSEDRKTEPCHLKVEKIKTAKSNSSNIGFNNGLVVNATKSTADQTEVITIQTIKDFEFTVDQDQVKGTCRFINSNRYEITLTVNKNAKPIIVLNQAPQDQTTSTIQTQLELQKDQRIEIGEIIKKARQQENAINIEPSANIESHGQNSIEKVFLSLQ